MKTSKLPWILIAIAALLIFFLPQGIENPQPRNISQVCFGGTCFQVELALTPEQQSQGLMNRTHMDADKGMLFIFPQDGIYPFWMKNTLIPLDIIWLDSNGTVVFISKNAQPCGPVVCPTINPGKNAKYVLEINGGTAERIGLKIGDRLTFDFQQ
jgi:uncharacterized membrane protein (UPF0127 family)